jgi:choline dehydrogenase-like flavoprotein
VGTESSADYVIVGAGSAGCVLANRLTEDPSVRVIVLEAGGADRSPNIKIPAAFAEQFHTKLDWDYYTEPEPHVNDRRLYLPRGKSLGGSSSMNAMLYVRGRPLDYDLWEEQGADGWGWDGIRPYFLKAENDERGASVHHGVGGPVNIQNQRSPRHVNADFIQAAEACGIPRSADYNSPEQVGVGMFQTFQKNGRRWSCADAYLRPAMKRDNLEVITRAEVQRLELSGTRVTGVVYKRRGKERVARAGREVILSAGAFNSPQILMLSGIGPAEHLREVGVPVAPAAAQPS